MNNPHVQRAFLLLEQSRHEMAEQELRGALAEDPNDPLAHGLLGLCLAHRKAYTEATQEAEQAIHLAPDTPFPQYVLASILYDRNRYPEAEAAIQAAIAMDPYDVNYFGLLASIKLALRDWQAALEAAEQGLAINPEDVRCTNLRALSLNKLGRTDTATESLQAALAKDPENSVAHTSLGWTQLQQGRSKEALESFREALRLDPTSDWARAGIVEALKSRNIVYRILLAYFLWISRLGGRAQWGVVIGAYIGYQVLRSVARNSPQLAVWIQPLLWLYIAFVVMTWIGVPLFNLLLRLNRYGRLALSRDQIVASNWVGLNLLATIAVVVTAFCTGIGDLWFTALMLGLLTMPMAAVFNLHKGWPRNMMAAYTLGLFVLGLISNVARFFPALLGLPSVAGAVAAGALLLFAIGIFVSQLVANWLVHQTPRH